MEPNWTRPATVEVRETDVVERGRILVDLLLLTDALPPVQRRELDAPTFRELHERR